MSVNVGRHSAEARYSKRPAKWSQRLANVLEEPTTDSTARLMVCAFWRDLAIEGAGHRTAEVIDLAAHDRFRRGD